MQKFLQLISYFEQIMYLLFNKYRFFYRFLLIQQVFTKRYRDRKDHHRRREKQGN